MIALALSFLALASASPMEVRSQPCVPSIGETQGASIGSGSNEIGTGSTAIGGPLVSQQSNIATAEFTLGFQGVVKNTFTLTCVCV